MVSIAVIRFPGTNNEHESVRAVQAAGSSAEILEHHSHASVHDFDGIWIAGGFSYGDVLRAGAIAGQSEIVREIVNSGKPVFGPCNGFQILTEAKVIPGALLPNTTTRFICKWINIRIPENNSYLNELAGEVLQIPIAHFEGNYFAGESEGRNVIAYYSDSEGIISPEFNPNGSVGNVAGVSSDNGRMVGMMPHPERSCLPHHPSQDGMKIINAFIQEVKR